MRNLCCLGRGMSMCVRILYNWWRNFGSLKIMLVLITEVAGCRSYRGTAVINTELDILKQNYMKVVWLPDTLTGPQRFQCWLDEHRPWISEPPAHFTSVWLLQFQSDPFQTQPGEISDPFLLPLSLPQQLFPLVLKSHSLFLQFPVLMSPSPWRSMVTLHREDQPRRWTMLWVLEWAYCLYMQLESWGSYISV